MSINIWMLIGFLLAAYSVMANDSLQTLGTYLVSNRSRTPQVAQMAFLCTVTSVVLGLGWTFHAGDPSWGRLTPFPLPTAFTWAYLLPPLTVLALTAWGAPVSTSFLVLTSFEPASIGKLLESSLSGYLLAFLIGLLAWGLGFWLLERWVFQQPFDDQAPPPLWTVLQWCTTGLLWSVWMVQDLANIFIYLPRRLNASAMVVCTLIVCIGLCLLVAIGGGPMQRVIQSKTNSTDLRSATAIDAMFGLCLLGQSLISSFPLSTTWVFLGLLGGREIGLRSHGQSGGSPCMNGPRIQGLGNDLWKAAVGLIVSVGVALATQPMIRWAAH